MKHKDEGRIQHTPSLNEYLYSTGDNAVHAYEKATVLKVGDVILFGTTTDAVHVEHVEFTDYPGSFSGNYATLALNDRYSPEPPTALTHNVRDSAFYVLPIIEEAMTHLPQSDATGEPYTGYPSDIPLFPRRDA